MSELVVSQLRDRGIAHLAVMNRSIERAAALAKEFGGTIVPWGNWDDALLTPDVVVTSVAAEDPVLLRSDLERVMNARGNRALFLMDLGVPRNIEAAASEIYNVYAYNLDDLSDIVQQNRSARESEIPKAELIIDEHVGKFLSWQASVELVGFVAALRQRVHQERSDFLRERLAGMRHLSDEDREHLALGIAPHSGEGDEIQIGGVQNQVDRHEHDDWTPAREHAGHADSEEGGGDDEVMDGGDHRVSGW